MDRQDRLYLLTGATSGMGLEAARALGRLPGAMIVAGARQPDRATALKAAVPPEQLAVLPLDTADLASVRAFAAAVDAWRNGWGLDGMALNAGIQLAGGERRSPDGHELTFATNHLGHFLLYDLLADALAPGAAVIATASGTHNPDKVLATRFGFRGGIFPDAASVAAGRLDPAAKPAQQGMDRYATSKLCNVMFVYGMARRVPASVHRFIAFDPGLMPGTGLARDRAPVLRFAWRHVLPLVVRSMEGVSTTVRSGTALARLLADPESAPGTGLHLDDGLAQTASSALSHRQDLQDDLIDTSRRLCGLPPDMGTSGGADTAQATGTG